MPGSWTPDGRLLFRRGYGGEGNRIEVLTVVSRESEPLFAVGENERYPKISSDGSLLAYRATENREDRVLVRPFPGPGRRLPASPPGAILDRPFWSADGNALYSTVSGRFYRTRVSASPELLISSPEALFKAQVA